MTNKKPTEDTANFEPGSRGCLSVKETCKRLSIGKTFFYDLAGEGAFDTLKIGGRRLVTIASVEALIEKQVEEEAGARDNGSVASSDEEASHGS